MSSAKMKIDRKVTKLVAMLNSLPGVSTISSCGGHAKPTSSQVANNQWYVDFELLPHQMAWSSLQAIAIAATEFTDSVQLSVWSDGGGVRFVIRGVDIAADEIAAFVEENNEGVRAILGNMN